MATTMTISLSDDMKAFVEERIKSGTFNSAGEFIQNLIREDQERAEQNRLEQMLLKGLDGGPSIPATDAYWDDLKSRATQRATERKSTPDVNHLS